VRETFDHRARDEKGFRAAWPEIESFQGRNAAWRSLA
jgi:hypothetical protein